MKTVDRKQLCVPNKLGSILCERPCVFKLVARRNWTRYIELVIHFLRFSRW